MLHEKLAPYRLILASSSPRRHYLMKEAGFEFEIRVIYDIPEEFPLSMPASEVAIYLAELKAKAFDGRLQKQEIVITADTVVILDGKVLGKPSGYFEAFDMLSSLSGRKHEVITGVCLKSENRQFAFSVSSDVWFRKLTEKEIHYYITEYSPFDKAGSYGVQEWIGYIGVERIEGSFFNVMGLPIQNVYVELEQFIDNLNESTHAPEKN